MRGHPKPLMEKCGLFKSILGRTTPMLSIFCYSDVKVPWLLPYKYEACRRCMLSKTCLNSLWYGQLLHSRYCIFLPWRISLDAIFTKFMRMVSILALSRCFGNTRRRMAFTMLYTNPCICTLLSFTTMDLLLVEAKSKSFLHSFMKFSIWPRLQ